MCVKSPGRGDDWGVSLTPGDNGLPLTMANAECCSHAHEAVISRGRERALPPPLRRSDV